MGTRIEDAAGKEISTQVEVCSCCAVCSVHHATQQQQQQILFHRNIRTKQIENNQNKVTPDRLYQRANWPPMMNECIIEKYTVTVEHTMNE